jgi:CHAT domain-containing protein
VIAGLWDVDDQAAAELMGALYAGIKAGLSPAASLRAAKLAFVHKGGNFRKPYFWGPFQVYAAAL